MRFARSRPTVVTCMADGSSLWRHTTTTALGTRCRSAGAVHPINYSTFSIGSKITFQGMALDVRQQREHAGTRAVHPDVLRSAEAQDTNFARCAVSLIAADAQA